MLYYIPQHSEQSIGGGWTFIKNFVKGMSPFGWTRTNDWRDADIVLIAGATMTNRDEIEAAKAAGKPIIFRVDNVPKDSRNRGTAIPRMRDFAKLADVVVYQSEWAAMFADPICGKGAVIYNGVDTTIFSFDPESERSGDCLYIQYSRNENKRWEEAWYRFHMLHRNSPNLTLHLVGQFSPEVSGNNFDFWNDERIVYHGIIDDQKQLADIMRSCSVLFFPAFADAAPNTVLEARACGMVIAGVNEVGGTKEMLNPDLDISLDRMCQEYDSLFKLALETKNI